MNGESTYLVIIAGSLILILSYIFNLIAERTNIPSVLMLILLDVVTQIKMSSEGCLAISKTIFNLTNSTDSTILTNLTNLTSSTNLTSRKLSELNSKI